MGFRHPHASSMPQRPLANAKALTCSLLLHMLRLAVDPNLRIKRERITASVRRPSAVHGYLQATDTDEVFGIRSVRRPVLLSRDRDTAGPITTSEVSSGVYRRRVYAESIVGIMSVPLTLLGLLEREPSHGYDLKRDYDAFFGRGKPLSFGQVYATLGRLARSGKVVVGESEAGAGPDRKRYVITDAGATEFETWLAEPVEAEPHLQTVLFAKVVLALMLGRDAERYLDVQRAAHLQRMRELTEIKRAGGLVDALLADHGLFHLESDLRWIDLTAGRLDALSEAVRS
jgi:DNA-binding PadR family transcriptional regulator